jgi:hypothetical protein
MHPVGRAREAAFVHDAHQGPEQFQIEHGGPVIE